MGEDNLPPTGGPGPRSPAGIVAEMFRLFSRNFTRMLTMTALVTVPLILAGQTAFGPDFATLLFGLAGEEPAEIPAPLMARMATYAVLYMVGLLAVTGAVAEAGARRLAGSNVSITRAYGVTIRRLPSMLGASVIAALAAGVPLVLSMMLAASTGGILGGVLLALTVLISTVILVRLVFAAFVALFERTGPVSALARSWTLVSGLGMRTFGLLVLVSLVVGLVQLALEYAGSPAPGLGTFLVAIVIPPLTALGNLLVYLDLRTRKEAFSLALLSEELESLASP